MHMGVVSSVLGAAFLGILVCTLDGFPFSKNVKLFFSGICSFICALWVFLLFFQLGDFGSKNNWKDAPKWGIEFDFFHICRSAFFSAGIFFIAQFWNILRRKEQLTVVSGSQPSVKWVDALQ